MIERRDFLKAAAGAAALASLPDCGNEPKWKPAAVRKPGRSRVAVLAAERYDDSLGPVLLDGLRLFPLDVRNKRVVLKPNFVEFDPDAVINTNPAVIAATIEAFRSLGAAEVIVAEGPGHRRDNEYLLSASGIGAMLDEMKVSYVNLNNDAVQRVPLRSRFTDLGSLYLPETVLAADLFVSMPKMKTHHWAGVTLSMKNLFGIVPGMLYGWPKNVLHWSGIENSILDINAALSMPRFNIVDGIVGMEGNGPIQGTAKRSGVVVMGPDPVAVDATCARLMGIDPHRIDYIEEAARFLGNAAKTNILQVAEDPTAHRRDYDLLAPFEHSRFVKMTNG